MSILSDRELAELTNRYGRAPIDTLVDVADMRRAVERFLGSWDEWSHFLSSRQRAIFQPSIRGLRETVRHPGPRHKRGGW